MAQSDDRIEIQAVQEALRAELADRGHHLASDSTGMSSSLYLMGANDTAAALFEIKPSADDAVYDLMYQGAWVAGMPPRFAVVPAAGAGAESLETLTQMRASPILFDIEDGAVRFRDLDDVIAGQLGV